MRYFIICLCFIYITSCQSGKAEKDKASAKAQNKGQEVPMLSPEEQNHYHDLVEKFVETHLLRGSFNGAILVAKNGVPVYEKYVGLRDFKTKDSITQDTKFQIASTSKPFTGAAVLRLAEEGKLNLHAPVEQYIPGFPYKEVTIRSLLNHRSGLPNYLYYMEKGGWARKMMATNEDVVNTLINWQPAKAYKHDTHFNYCNTNYVLLAFIVEKVSGMSFPKYLQMTFFEPYGMTNTYVHTIADSARLAPSYDGFGGLWALDFSDGPVGDKNIYSTPRDLLKWDQAWYNGLVIKQAMYDSATKGYSNERPSMHNYGLGWRILNIPNGKKVVYHHGRWHGFNSVFSRLTDEKVTIIILTNKFNRSIYSTARKMYDLFGDYGGKEETGEE